MFLILIQHAVSMNDPSKEELKYTRERYFSPWVFTGGRISVVLLWRAGISLRSGRKRELKGITFLYPFVCPFLQKWLWADYLMNEKVHLQGEALQQGRERRKHTRLSKAVGRGAMRAALPLVTKQRSSFSRALKI